MWEERSLEIEAAFKLETEEEELLKSRQAVHQESARITAINVQFCFDAMSKEYNSSASGTDFIPTVADIASNAISLLAGMLTLCLFRRLASTQNVNFILHQQELKNNQA